MSLATSLLTSVMGGFLGKRGSAMPRPAAVVPETCAFLSRSSLSLSLSVCFTAAVCIFPTEAFPLTQDWEYHCDAGVDGNCGGCCDERGAEL